jgi:SAM-dependent methyltransferase
MGSTTGAIMPAVGRSIPFDGGIAARYDATRGGNIRARNVVDGVLPWLPEGPIVEIGVGTGIVGATLAARGRAPVGIDLSAEMLGRAASRLPGRLTRADATAPPVRDGVAAGVVAIHVLHLVGDLRAAVGAAARMLRAGGRLVVSGIVGDRQEGDDVSEAHGDIDERLRPLPPPTIEEITAAGAGFGLRLAHDGFLERLTFGRAPNVAAQLLADRTWSWCWDLPDDVWAAEVQPVIDRLRALPEPDRPRPHWMERRIAVFERA